MLTYKGYTGVFEYDPDLEIFSGHVVDLRDEVLFEGTSVEELKQSMRDSVDDYLESFEGDDQKPERPFSGRFNVRTGPDLHRMVAVAAAAAGESMNDWVVRALTEGVANNAGDVQVKPPDKDRLVRSRDLRGIRRDREAEAKGPSKARKHGRHVKKV